ncbi:MAG TPA: hypothetical protein VNL35_11655 [Chloroflexota bacterium]|nr:hypothetical protein [Chloroflexota bacterium]
MRGILYYVEEPKPIELHGLQRLMFEDLTLEEARILMRIPGVRQPGVPTESLTLRGRLYNSHEDNRVLIHNHWGITDIHVVGRRSLVTMLLPSEDLTVLLREDTPNA